MHNPSVYTILRELDFFDPLRDSAIVEMVAIARPQCFPAGAVIFRESEEHPTFYIVHSGSIALDMHVPERGDVRILSVGAGEVLGWSALVGNTVMTATATTLEPTTTVALPGHDLRELCEWDHEIGYRIMTRMATALSRRLLATRLQLLDLFAETTPQADAQAS